MRKLAVCLSVVLSLGLGGWAQTPKGRPGGRMQAALSQLNLSEDQRAKIKQIRADARASNQDRKVTREQIGAVLTAEQKARLMQLMEESKAQPGRP